MTDQELIKALRTIKVLTGSLACMGCGHEHNCGIHGCAIMSAAADRLEVLPCKVGDELWTNIAIRGDRYRQSDRPYRVKVVFIGLGPENTFFDVEYSNGRIFPVDKGQFGKTVFRTQEEAAKALEVKDG